MSIQIKPLGTRVLVEPLARADTKKGGILLPDSSVYSLEGRVLAVGSKVLDIRVGDVVLLPKIGGQEIETGSRKLLLIDLRELTGVVTEE